MSSIKDRLAEFEAKGKAPEQPAPKLNSAASVASRIASLERVNSGARSDSAKVSTPEKAGPSSLSVPTPEGTATAKWKKATGLVSAAQNWRISSTDSPTTPRAQAGVGDATTSFELTAAFKSLKLNGEGKADVRELAPAVKRIMGTVSDAEVAAAVKAIGKPPDGRVAENEFSSVVKHIQTSRGNKGFGAGHPKALQTSSKQQSSASLLKVHGTHGGTHSFSEEEKAAFARYISYALADDQDLRAHLPIDDQSLELFDKVADGIVLCKFVNYAVPETIDDRAINRRGKLSLFQVTENLNLAINAAKAIGCHIVNIDASDIYQGTPHLVLGMVWQVVKIALLSHVNLREHPQLVVLLNEEEELSKFVKLQPEKILLRWVNWHLEQSGRPERITNFGRDVADSVAYTVLLHRIAPKGARATLDALSEPDRLKRAMGVVRTASAMRDVTFSITAMDIVDGNEKLNLAFAAALFNACPGLDIITETQATTMLEEKREADHAQAEEETLSEDESREERAFRMWINSLGIEKYIHSLFTDTRDSVAVLQVMDRLKPGLVEWHRVNARPRTVYETVENGNYTVDLGKAPPPRGFGLSLVGIQGKDLADSNHKYILAVIWQLMRFHVLNFIALSVARAADVDPGAVLSPGAAAVASMPSARGGKPKALTEDDVLAWANDAVKRSGSTRKIDSFKDRTIKTGMFLLDLVAAVEPRCVDREMVAQVEYDLIHGAPHDKCQLNAKYAISCARKLGCAVFLLWEDIVEVKQKMVFTFIATIMAKQVELQSGGHANVGHMVGYLEGATHSEAAASPGGSSTGGAAHHVSPAGQTGVGPRTPVGLALNSPPWATRPNE